MLFVYELSVVPSYRFELHLLCLTPVPAFESRALLGEKESVRYLSYERLVGDVDDGLIDEPLL